MLFRLLFSLSLLVFCAGSGWYLWDRFPQMHTFVTEKLHAAACRTLEVRYSPEQIMDKHRKELIKGSGYCFLDPQLLFYPYVLMNTKFATTNSSTQEGVLLWGLNDGEMVLNTSNWERSHGFEDCLIANATENDFKILRVVMEAGGGIDRERLYQKFKADGPVVDRWIKQCRAKNLVVNSGGRLRLHLQQPKMDNLPLTILHEPLVTKPAKECIKTQKRYSVPQICKLAQMAFGPDFAIRKTEQIYLPVYGIGVQNPDGSVLITYWNALNGKRWD